MPYLETMPFKAENYLFSRLDEVAKTRALTPDERDQYDHSLKVYRDDVNVYSYAVKEGRAEGHAAGLAEARAEILLKLSALGVDEARIAQL